MYINYDVNRLANVWVLNSEIMFQIFPFCRLISKNVHGAPISSDEWTAYLNSTSINLMQLIISQITVVMVKITSPIQPQLVYILIQTKNLPAFFHPRSRNSGKIKCTRATVRAFWTFQCVHTWRTTAPCTTRLCPVVIKSAQYPVAVVVVLGY